jgi:hypothetical protein
VSPRPPKLRRTEYGGKEQPRVFLKPAPFDKRGPRLRGKARASLTGALAEPERSFRESFWSGKTRTCTGTLSYELTGTDTYRRCFSVHVCAGDDSHSRAQDRQGYHGLMTYTLQNPTGFPKDARLGADGSTAEDRTDCKRLGFFYPAFPLPPSFSWAACPVFDRRGVRGPHLPTLKLRAKRAERRGRGGRGVPRPLNGRPLSTKRALRLAD